MKNKKESHISKGSRIIFGMIAIGFTVISAWNGFDFYRILFGISMALLITAVFEIARIACLFLLFHIRKKFSVLTLLNYLIVTSVCAFASVNTFTSDVIFQNRKSNKKFEIQIHEIKKAYSENIEKKLSSLNRDIKYLENMVAKYHNRDYWKRRLSQVLKNRDKTITERDKFLSVVPKNLEEWVKAKSALLGLEIREQSGEDEEIISVTLALKELWNLDKVTAQKIIGIIITLAVELSILLLTSLSAPRKDIDVNESNVSFKKELLDNLNSRFNEKNVKKFISLNKRHFDETGKLLPLRRLNNNLRPIRIFLQNYNLKELEKLFER